MTWWEIVVGWPCPVAKSPPSQSLTLFLQKDGGQNQKGKSKKNLMGHKTGSLLIEGKKEEKKINQAMQRQSLTTSHQQTNVQLVSEQQLLWKKYLPVLLLSMTFYGMEYFLHGMEYPFGQLRSTVPAVSSSKLFPTSSLLAEVHREKDRWPWHCASTVQQ